MNSHNLDLPALTAQIRRNGPTRVVINRQANATTPDIALMNYGILPDVVFIRSDGWSLGAPWQYSSAAYRLWAGDWVAVVLCGDGTMNTTNEE